VKLGEHAIDLDPSYTFALLDLAYAFFSGKERLGKRPSVGDCPRTAAQ